VAARGGLPAIRGVLASMRTQRPTTTGELVLHHANRVLHADLRPVLARYGFEPAELTARPVPAIPGCTLIGSAQRDAIKGTSGADTVCGLAGNDVVTGGAGRDVLEGGPGNDVLEARDRRRDVVRGGPGRDTARIDRGLDRVVGVERLA
jgi:RTX calcium-binding nonapeptide repeat (4 copies)